MLKQCMRSFNEATNNVLNNLFILYGKPNTVKTGMSFRHLLRHRNSAAASVVSTLKSVCGNDTSK
jgi:hypothetical protein